MYLLQITRGEMFYSPNSVDQALDTRLNITSFWILIKFNVYDRDALAKVLYVRLFSWLVKWINKIINKATQHSSIAVLDIFGFEVCIPFLN